MVGECIDNIFVCDGKLVPAAEFSSCFKTAAKYIYEVFRVQQGIPVFIEDHLERLWNTAALEGLNLSLSKVEVLADISLLILKNRKSEGNIKIFIRLPADDPIGRLVYFTPHVYPTLLQFKEGVQVGLFEAERNNPNAKVMDVSLRNATELARQKYDAYEILLVDRNGNITEGSRSNVFFINSNKLITPPVHTVLEGITRRKIMYLCAQNNIPVSEKEVNVNDLHQMESVFITGTSRRVLPVNQIGNQVFNVSNPLVSYLQTLFEGLVNSYLGTRYSPVNEPASIQ